MSLWLFGVGILLAILGLLFLYELCDLFFLIQWRMSFEQYGYFNNINSPTVQTSFHLLVSSMFFLSDFFSKITFIVETSPTWLNFFQCLFSWILQMEMLFPFFSASSLKVYINPTTFANAVFVMIKDKTLGLTRVPSERHP